MKLTTSRGGTIVAAMAVLAFSTAGYFALDSRQKENVADATNALTAAAQRGDLRTAENAKDVLTAFRAKGFTVTMTASKIDSLIAQTHGVIARQKFAILSRKWASPGELQDLVNEIQKHQRVSDNTSLYSVAKLNTTAAQNLVTNAKRFDPRIIPPAERHTAAQVAAMKNTGRAAGIKTRVASSRLHRRSSTRTVATAPARRAPTTKSARPSPQ